MYISAGWCNGINVNLFLIIFLVSKQGKAKNSRVLSKDGQQLMSFIKQVDKHRCIMLERLWAGRNELLVWVRFRKN